MDAGLAETRKETKDDMKVTCKRLGAMGSKMDAGQAEVKADIKAIGDDVALKFQAVWDEVTGVRGCVDGVWEEMKTGHVKMTDKINKIQTEIKGLEEGQEQLKVEIEGNREVKK